MGYIYKISNDINNHVYIGQTTRSIESRWKQHIADSCSEREKHRIIYRAINKYGIEHFYIELVEECEDYKLNEREQYWIQQYNSFNDGYNMTLGGESLKKYDIDRQEVYRLWDEGKSIKEISNIIIGKPESDNRSCIRAILYTYENYSEEEAQRRGIQRQAQAKFKSVKQWDKNGILLAEFMSAREAEQITGISYKNISNVVCKKSLTAGGYYWTYGNEELDLTDARYNKIKKAIRPVYVYNLEGKLIQNFPSIRQANAYYGYQPNTYNTPICRMCNGERTEPYQNCYFSFTKRDNLF